jgi:hypothetical protein
LSEEKPTVTLRQTGSDGVNRSSIQRGDDLRTIPGDVVHIECRQKYTRPSDIARAVESKKQQSIQKKTELRSMHNIFNFKEHCLFCGQPAKVDRKRKYEVFEVSIKPFQVKLHEVCSVRKDQWSETVLGRLASVNDLRAADAVYHKQCYSNFCTGKDIPRKVDTGDKVKKRKVGRPENEDKKHAFWKVVEYLEQHGDELITVDELVTKMTEYLVNTGQEPFSSKHMKTKLKEHFGEKILITLINGKPSVVTLRDTANSILCAFHQEQKDKSDDEKVNIIRAAAKLIESDVKSLETQHDIYPSTDCFQNPLSAMEYLPKTLQILLSTMFAEKHNDVLLASIGQAIMQAIRPRAILAPLQLGLGVQMHHHFASRFLIDTLYKHGFTCSYTEVKRYERNAAVVQGTNIDDLSKDQFVQFIADNVDHNVSTIDGRGTFHGMGIIATITPKKKNVFKPISKLHVTAEEIATVGRINIEYFKIPPELSPLKYHLLPKMPISDMTSGLDVLWETSLLLQNPRPSWSGMMQMLHTGQYPGQSSVLFLPMIDMNPSDPSCIYSTLKFVISQARFHGVTPILTFDQPLYWKALSIIRSQAINSDMRSVVLRLGGFHMQMSFLGSIGNLMAGSGLQELLEIVYASNTVSHMLTGKAVSRAVRGHMLVDAALSTIIIADAYNVPVPTKYTECTDEDMDNDEPEEEDPQLHDLQPENDTQTDLKAATALFDGLLSSTVATEEVYTSDVLKRIKDTFDEKKELMTMRTAKLWLQYIDMVNILRTFLKAERTGNWQLHLQAIREMLPYFAASGHSLYAKSAYIYLQMMTDLPNSHPDVHKKFE